MLKKRKATRDSLDELRKKMPVLSEIQQQGYMAGGPGMDCWWRVMAYLSSGGTNYGPEAAMLWAQNHLGSGFNPDNFAFTGNPFSFVNAHLTGTGSFVTGSIFMFNPSEVCNTLGDGISGGLHTVVFRKVDHSSNRMYFYCPQTRTTGSVCASSFANANRDENFVIRL